MTDTPITETAPEATEGKGFDALAGMGTQAAAPVRERIVDAQGRAYATGKRKNAIARVWIKPGSGKITINGRDQEIYLARPVLRMMIAAAGSRRPSDPVRRRRDRRRLGPVGPGRCHPPRYRQGPDLL